MSRNGMAGGLSNRNYNVNLRYLPDAKRPYTVNFDRLDGGINLYELPYRLNPNESPDMRNLHWRNGALGCRPGQRWLIEPAQSEELGFTAARELYWDYVFVHVDDEIRCYDPEASIPAYTTLKTGVPLNRGTFFRYGDSLMYKNNGGYYQIDYNPIGATVQAKFPVTTVSDHEFVPITYINTNPATMAGTAYQPENRLSHKKEIWYTVSENQTSVFYPEQTSSTRSTWSW